MMGISKPTRYKYIDAERKTTPSTDIFFVLKDEKDVSAAFSKSLGLALTHKAIQKYLL